MPSTSLAAEIVVVPCLKCGQKNRLTHQHRKVGFRCGACKEPIKSPFALHPKTTGKIPVWLWWLLGALILWLVLKK